MAENKGLDFGSDIQAGVPVDVIGDPYRLRQILLNLLGNAIKFTDSGRIDLRIYIPEQPFSGRLAFDIRDTGIGIPEDKLGRLFKPFSQVDSSTTRRYGGTGLGLLISKELVEKMNGRIVVQSTPGKGTCFSFQIAVTPTAKNDLSQNGVQGTARASDTTPLPKNLKILLAEDNLVNQKVALNMLRQIDQTHVTVVENGKAAVEAFSRETFTQEPFDVILMDGHMPVMDGIEATRQIRKFEQDKKCKTAIPIITVTACAMIGDQEKFLNAGMDDYITKPLKTEDIETVMARCLTPK